MYIMRLTWGLFYTCQSTEPSHAYAFLFQSARGSVQSLLSQNEWCYSKMNGACLLVSMYDFPAILVYMRIAISLIEAPCAQTTTQEEINTQEILVLLQFIANIGDCYCKLDYQFCIFDHQFFILPYLGFCMGCRKGFDPTWL